MKKSLLFGLIFSLCFAQQPAFSQSSDVSDQPEVLPETSPYMKSMEKAAIEQMKSFMLKDKDKIMESLNKVHNYTEEEYQALYNNYEINPPFIEQDGRLVLNPDYISKNTKYIRVDGKLVKNENYQENPNHEKLDLTKMINIPKEEKKLGKKSYSINPDAFY